MVAVSLGLGEGAVCCKRRWGGGVEDDDDDAATAEDALTAGAEEGEEEWWMSRTEEKSGRGFNDNLASSLSASLLTLTVCVVVGEEVSPLQTSTRANSSRANGGGGGGKSSQSSEQIDPGESSNGLRIPTAALSAPLG